MKLYYYCVFTIMHYFTVNHTCFSLQGTNVIFIDSYYEDDINICIKIHNKKFITTGNVKMKKTHLLKLFCEKGSLIICYIF